MPRKAPDFEPGREKTGGREGVLGGIQHAVQGEIVNAVLQGVTSTVAMSVEVGLAAFVLFEEVVKSGAVPGAMDLLGNHRVMTKDKNGLPGGGCLLKLGGKPGELCVTYPAVPVLRVGESGPGNFPELGFCLGRAGVPGAVAVGAHLGGIDYEKALASLSNCVVGPVESELGRHPGLEFIRDIKVMVTQGMMEGT